MISRNCHSAQSTEYDLIIVGGGIYGAMLLLEAGRRNLRALLLEKDDFGAQTSRNSLRIIHGGLRYLQSLDLVRFHESVTERQWFLQTFPEFVKPMPCMMPLYNKGIKRPPVLKAALTLNDLLSAGRNKGVQADRAIPNGQILTPSETADRFAGVNTQGLSGAALWYDAHAPDTQRIIMETLHWAISLGGEALNYVEVENLIQTRQNVSGVRAIDRINDQQLEIRSRQVINATGPDSRSFAQQADKDIPPLFKASHAWNILFKVPTPSDYALALTPNNARAHTYFLHPWKGRLFAGTGHAPANPGVTDPMPAEDAIDEFISDLNLVLGGLQLTRDDIEHIYCGFLPVTETGGVTLTKRAHIHDHARYGGPKNLFSISGIKFTTAHKEAQRLLDLMAGTTQSPLTRPALQMEPHQVCLDYDWIPSENNSAWKDTCKKIIETESVLHLNDLIFRRTSIGDNFDRTKQMAPGLANLFDWDDSRKQQELSKVDGVIIS